MVTAAKQPPAGWQSPPRRCIIAAKMDDKSGIALVVVGVAALIFIFLVPRLARRRSSAAKPGTFDEGRSRDSRDEMERLLIEIQELSREQIAKLDTKIRMMGQLLAECDRKKAELEALLGRAPAGNAPPPPPPRPSNPLHDQVYALQDKGKSIAEICAATELEKGEVELILGLRRMPPAGR